MTGPIIVSITMPPLTFDLHVASSHRLKASPFSSHPPANTGPPMKSGSRAISTKVTGRCEVVILAVQLTGLIGSKAKWHTQRELVVRQGRSTPRTAPAASDKQPIRFTEAPEMVG